MWTFEIPSDGEPEDDEYGEETNENDAGVIHRGGGCRDARWEANHDTKNHNPETGKGVAEVSEPAKVEIPRGELFAALEQSDPLRDGVGDVEVQYGTGDDRVECGGRRQIQKAITANENEGGHGCSDGELEVWIDACEVIGKWNTVL